jgi:hypothetical protein
MTSSLFDKLGDMGLDSQTANIFDPVARIRKILDVGLPCLRPVPEVEALLFCFDQLCIAPCE